MLGMLALGFLVGVRHALEADHVAAVAALATRSTTLADTVKVAAVWGGGHAGSLLAIGGLLVAFGIALPDRVARGFEAAAGAILVVLGLDVLRRLRARRIHFHVHQHAGGVRHLHAHAHAGAAAHTAAAHEHEHPRRLLPRAFAVGGVHGVAGSGALVLLSMQAAGSGPGALAYVAAFAAGSILGMVAFSLALSLPLAVAPRVLERTAGRLEAVLGVITITVGCWIALRAAAIPLP